ncbi:hypothetical protein QE419_000374 [Brevundimonas vesicularis]|uniref:hypothetical protein n=1 Tax=Brevundimonas vesicularis TaxID=41276 RepID=UPI00277F6831|nr:hypothetical protein [Brevundimonas vesicularis]MDQ1191608.1 hypothetical protein [Brevundimonas vesicularis]
MKTDLAGHNGLMTAAEGANNPGVRGAPRRDVEPKENAMSSTAIKSGSFSMPGRSFVHLGRDCGGCLFLSSGDHMVTNDRRKLY